MMKTGTLIDNKGVSLIELLIVLVSVGILAGFGVPEYMRYVSKSKVRSAATELMQNMRMTRTMAIKENRTYLITFASNTYSIGVDLDPAGGNGSLADAGDVYGDGGAVKVINVPNEYGVDVVLGESNFVVTPTMDNNGNALSGQTAFSFMADSSSSPNGMIFFQHVGRGYTFYVELANTAGKTNLFMWQGDINNAGVTTWTELR